MENSIKTSQNEEHLNNNANYYCIECKIYLCNKCENFHNKLFKNHNRYN